VRKSVMLSAGMPVGELLAVVEATFGARPVGFEFNGFLIPPSVLCARPQLYRDRTLQIRIAAPHTAAAAAAPAPAPGPAAAAAAPRVSSAPAARPAAAAARSFAAPAPAPAPAPVSAQGSALGPATVHGPRVFSVNAGESLDVYASDLGLLVQARARADVLEIEPLIDEFKAVAGSLNVASFFALIDKLAAPLPERERAILKNALRPVYELFANRNGGVDPVRCIRCVRCCFTPVPGLQ
jgi:hypothetical protein